MYKYTVTYYDYDDEQVTEDLYFNLTKNEALDWELECGGLDAYVEKMKATNNTKEVIEFFRSIFKKTYGRRSADGKRFKKNEEILEEFLESPAYDEVIFNLLNNPDEAAKFMVGIMPHDSRAAAAKAIEDELKNAEA